MFLYFFLISGSQLPGGENYTYGTPSQPQAPPLPPWRCMYIINKKNKKQSKMDEKKIFVTNRSKKKYGTPTKIPGTPK